MSVTIFKNAYRTPCQTYICHNMSDWFIGIDGGPLNTAYTLCDSCVGHMLENLPENFDGKTAIRVVETVIEAPIEIAEVAPPIVEPKPQEPEPEVVQGPALPTAAEQLEAKTTYRCLECGAEFGDKRGLSNHMRGKHKEG